MNTHIKKAPLEYRHTAVAVDTVIFSVFNKTLHTLVIPIHRPPHYVSMKGFPGGLVGIDETAYEATLRTIKEKVDIADLYIEQLFTFTDIERDARNRVVSIAHLGLVPSSSAGVFSKGEGTWVPVFDIGKLAYDHNEILEVAHNRLAGKLLYTNIARHLLPKKFTLSELQGVYEVVCGEVFDKRNFRKKILSMNIVKDTGELQTGVANRPAALYQFMGNTVVEVPLIMG